MHDAAAPVKDFQSPQAPRTPSASRRRLFYLIGSILAVALAVLVWDQFIKYRVIAKRWGVVTAGKVYRSGQVSKWMLEKKIHEHGIQVIIDLNGIESDDEHQAAEIATAKRLGIEHHRFKLSGDGTGDIRNYANAIAVIHHSEQSGRPVLVHCSAGAQRTGGVVATYRMFVLGQSPQEAYAELGRYGWEAETDYELVNFVNAHMRELAGLLLQKGVIDEVPDPLPVLGP